MEMLRKVFIFLSICFTIFAFSNHAHALPHMSEYCYIPPFAIDSATPPNVLIVYEKGEDILKRAYEATYYQTRAYYGFFDRSVHYTYDKAKDYFIGSSCNPGSESNCFPGNLLNWALMSSLDISRKVLIGFGWPDTGSGGSAGEVFTYSGTFHGDKPPVSIGQWEDGQSTHVSTTLTVGASERSYTFCLSKATGSNATGLSILTRPGPIAPSCAGGCTDGCSSIVSGGRVVMELPDDNREGIIQKFVDRDRDYHYDADAPIRIGVRRWNKGHDKQQDIMKNGTLSAEERYDYFKTILTSLSKAPPDDPHIPYLGAMMKDVVSYFEGDSCSYCDNSTWTQTPYSWSSDPGKACRENFSLFITTGGYLGESSDKLSPLPASCPETYEDNAEVDAFTANVCYAYQTDLSSETGKQHVRTHIVHATFFGNGKSNTERLKYASRIGGGEYLNAGNPSELENLLSETLLNILSSAASASTVGAMTTQSRESSSLAQAFFYPKLQEPGIKWTGATRLLWSDPSANLREDTENPGVLDLVKDKILSFFYDPKTGIYKARVYTDSDGDSRIESCSGPEKKNEDVSAIWEAQDLLEARTPDENAGSKAAIAADRKRQIKTALGDSNGTVSPGTAFTAFETSISPQLQSFWSDASFCSNGTKGQCTYDSDCNSCTEHPETRACPQGTHEECYYCSSNPSLSCQNPGSTDGCSFDYGSCLLATRYCTNNPSAFCTADNDCTRYAFCIKGTCQDNPGRSCSVNEDCAGICSGRCSENINRFCSLDTECRDNYGFCTADSCITASGGTCEPVCNDDCARSIIKYIRGYDKPNPSGEHFRIRHTCNGDTDCPSGSCSGGICSEDSRDIEKTRKLGDIVYSSPRISSDGPLAGYAVRYNDETYRRFTENVLKKLTPLVIVGANDGMVHAFELGKLRNIDPPSAVGGGKQIARFTDTSDGSSVPADLGHEQWAYIPYNVLPYLRWYCEDGYCHIPMLDGRFTILDASIQGDASANRRESSWRRLLIGTMGIGGKKITLGSKTWSSSIFVIDVTDPLNPVLIWERPLPDHTLTSSNPAIVRLGSRDTNGSWYLVMGSGPENILTNKTTYKTTATKIFIFDLRDGTVIEKEIPTANSAVGDLLAADIDSDYQVDDVYFGTYGLSHVSPTGTLYRIRIKDGNSYRVPANWSIETVVDAQRPVFAAPEIAQDADGNVWLYFGTGLYLTLQEAQPTSDREFLLGFIEKEECWRNGCSSPYDTFLDVTGASFENAQALKIGCFCEGTMTGAHECSSAGSCGNVNCSSGETTAVLEVQGATLAGGHPACNGLKDDEAIQCLSKQMTTNYHGWRRKLVGEKMFSKPLIAGGLANFTTFAPEHTPCSPGGTTRLVSVHYVTGTPYIEPEIVLPEGTSGSYSSTTILPSVSIGKGIPPFGESLSSLSLAGTVYKVITQVSGGLPGTALQPSVPYKTGYVLWITK